MEITANQLLGLSVFDLSKGEKIGQVRSFLLDPKAKELLALLITNKKLIKDDSVLCLSDVVGLSMEAVTVDSPAVLRKKGDCPHLKDLLKSPPDVNGLSILKKDGTFLGRADSFYLNSETGKVTKIEIHTGFLGNIRKERAFIAIEDIDIIGSDMILALDQAKIKSLGKQPGESGGRQTQSSVKMKKENFEAGCKEKIMAFSNRRFSHQQQGVVFPEVEKSEEQTKPEPPH